MVDIVLLELYDIYMVGCFDMIGVVCDDFINYGVVCENMYVDVFVFIK